MQKSGLRKDWENMKGLGEYADTQPIRVQHFENRLREMLRRKFIHRTVYRLAAQLSLVDTVTPVCVNQ